MLKEDLKEKHIEKKVKALRGILLLLHLCYTGGDPPRKCVLKITP